MVEADNCAVCGREIRGDETFVPVNQGDMTQGGIHVRCLGTPEPGERDPSPTIRVMKGWGPLRAVEGLNPYIILGDDIQVVPTSQDNAIPLRIARDQWEELPAGHIVAFLTPYREGGRVVDSFNCPLCNTGNKLTQAPLQGLPTKITCTTCAVTLWHQGDSEPYNGGGTGTQRACYTTLENI